MNARRGFSAAMALAFACALALSGCSSQAASTSAGSGSSAASATASSIASSTTSSASAASSASAPTTGTTATIDLDYNAGTGYEWMYGADPEEIVELVNRDTEDLVSEPGITGGGLRDHFTFRAVKAGEVSLTFDLVRGWETDEEPAETQIYAFTVTDDLQMVLNPYKSDFDNEPIIG